MLRAAAASLFLACFSASARGLETTPGGVTALESRTDSLLAAVLGPGRARVLLRSVRERAEPPRRETRRPAVLWDDIRKRLDTAPPVLPGFHAPRSLKSETLRALRKEAGLGPVRTILQATLILDPSVDAEATDLARKTLTVGLPLDPDRGDSLTIVRLPIGGIRPKAIVSPEAGRGLLLFAAAAAAGLFLIFLLLKIPAVLGAVFAAPGRPWVRVPLFHRDGPAGLTAPAPGEARSVAAFLAPRPAEDAARVLGSLDAEFASEVFLELPPAPRRASARALFKESRPAPGGGVLRELQAHLDARARGPGLLSEILLRSPEEVRRDILADLDSADPVRTRELAGSLPTLDALARAAPESVRLCLAGFTDEDIALALYDARTETRDRLLQAIPGPAADLVLESAEHLVPDAMRSVHRRRAELFLRWKRLEGAGRVGPLRLVGAA